MASIIKNQILKHLSKFAKNLSLDQINLSTLKGEGELRNLELNEEILTDLLELPSWMRLTRADCNRVTVRIPWTKLKTVPINLMLDEVKVELETCEILRTLHPAPKKPAHATGGHYGFVDKVVDGITVSVNSVILTLRSHAFIASFQMSRILLESMNPNWTKAELRMTRLKDTDKQEVLIFKEFSWQTVRIEAKSTVNEDLTPLRLITNQARCRLTIKKRMTDCTVLGCRLVLILDDLLWVLTDDQLKAALHFADSLSGLLKRATEETQKIKGARKLENMSEMQSRTKETSSKKKAGVVSAAAKVFNQYDVLETSYHFYSDRIDLHLCDDPGSKGRSCHPQLQEGGAFQVSFSGLQLDFYPYHLATGNRSAWIRYQESVHSKWLSQSLMSFEATLLDALSFDSFLQGTNTSNNHTPLSRAKAPKTPKGQRLGSNTPQSKEKEGVTIKENVLSQFKKLLTANLVVRLSNFSMWKVSTSKEKASPQEFISGQRDQFSLPDDMPVIHFEYTQFYYPGGIDFPVPPPKFFGYVNPVQINLDPLTVLWLNAFALNVQKSVEMLALEKGEPPYLDVKIEAIMFKVIIDSDRQVNPRQKDRPRSLHVQVSRILASNMRSLETGSKADLAQVLNHFQNSDLFFGTAFPNLPTDIHTVCDKMVQHATGFDFVSNESYEKKLNDLKRAAAENQNILKLLSGKMFWTDAKDVWYIFFDPIWADFHGTPTNGSRPIPLVDAVPVTIWLYKQPEDFDESTKSSSTADDKKEQETLVNAKLHILATVNSLVSIQLNHYQLLFLLRTVEMISEVTMFLSEDLRQILGDDEGSVAVGAIVPQIDLSLLMSAVSQSKDSIGGDYDDSVAVQETSSVYSIGALQGNVRNSSPSPDSGSDQDLSTSENEVNVLQKDNSAAEPPSAPESPQRRGSNLIPSNEGLASSVPATPSQTSLATKNQPVPSIHLESPLLQNKKHASSGPHYQRNHQLATSLTNMMASLNSSLNQSHNESTPNITTTVPEDDSVSLRSDDSSDSENFVVITPSDSYSAREQFDATLFGLRQNDRAASNDSVEYALEVTEDYGNRSGRSSQHASGGNTPKFAAPERPASIIEAVQKEGMISVATFHVGRFDIAQQSVGGQACIKIQAASLSGEECPAISWEEFQNKFSIRGKGWCDSTLQPPSTWCFKLRFSTSAPKYEDIMNHMTSPESSTSMSLREKISRSANAFVELRAQNLPLQFYMSTLNGLGDLFEDEVIPTPIPLKIILENIALHLIEDRPSPNISSPGHLPIDIAIPGLKITRDTSGLFSIQAHEPSSSSEEPVAHASLPPRNLTNTSMSHHLDLVRSGVASIETELHQRASLLAVDNANLRSLLEATTNELQSLKKRIEEDDLARGRCTKLQQQVQTLDKENRSLKETLKYLQEELLKAGKKS